MASIGEDPRMRDRQGLGAARPRLAVLPLFCLVVGGSSPRERRAGPGREGTPRGRSNGGCCRSHIRAEHGSGWRVRQCRSGPGGLDVLLTQKILLAGLKALVQKRAN